ncbi:MAG: SPFH domain-containing protein, partial [Verrucomicrobiota bacterium]
MKYEGYTTFTTEQNEDIGVGGSGSDAGLMLTGDENIVDIDFQVVWNISDPKNFLFELRDPRTTIRAVSESAMREIIAQSRLAPILNR